MYSTDNGAEKLSWPDGGQSPFRSEKGTQFEGGFRVPTAIRWPGVIKPGTVLNDIFAHEDMLPPLVAVVHLDGYNITDASPANRPAPARSSSTSTTTDRSWRYAINNTRSSSRNSARTAPMLGRSRS